MTNIFRCCTAASFLPLQLHLYCASNAPVSSRHLQHRRMEAPLRLVHQCKHGSSLSRTNEHFQNNINYQLRHILKNVVSNTLPEGVIPLEVNLTARFLFIVVHGRKNIIRRDNQYADARFFPLSRNLNQPIIALLFIQPRDNNEQCI